MTAESITSERTRNLRIVVVGAGALGNEVIKALGLLGVRELTVVDPDIIEPGNLTRSILFRTTDCVGRNKAEMIARAAQAIFPDTRFRAIPREIADVSLQELVRTNLIFSCVDSDLARLEIAYLCTKLDVPCCDAGLGADNPSHGRVTWFAGKLGACFGCMLPSQRRRELLTVWDPVTTPCREFRDAAGPSSIPTTASIVSSLQVNVGLRNFLDKLPHSQTIEVNLAGVARLEQYSVPRSAHCPLHWNQTQQEQMHPAPPFETQIGEWLSTLDSKPSARAYLHLDWPVCTRAQCRKCDFSWSPMVRVALIPRSTCPACGSGNLLAVESIRSIDRNSEWARRHFADLHIPEDQLVTVRFLCEH